MRKGQSGGRAEQGGEDFRGGGSGFGGGGSGFGGGGSGHHHHNGIDNTSQTTAELTSTFTEVITTTQETTVSTSTLAQATTSEQPLSSSPTSGDLTSTETSSSLSSTTSTNPASDESQSIFSSSDSTSFATDSFSAIASSAAILPPTTLPQTQDAVSSSPNLTMIGLAVGGSVFGSLILGLLLFFLLRRHCRRRPRAVLPFIADEVPEKPVRPSPVLTFTSRSIAAANRYTMRSEYTLRTPISNSGPQDFRRTMQSQESEKRRADGDENTLAGDLQEFYSPVVDDWESRRGFESARLSGESMEMDPQLKYQFTQLDRQMDHQNAAGGSNLFNSPRAL